MDNILTIFLVVYNHEKTITDTFRGIISQKTKYPFVVKILDDHSTDKTLDICQSYIKKYPKMFQLFTQPVNTKGVHIRIALENEIKTPYFTIVEGDDYYISEKHIENAIAFLEANKEYNMYASNVLHKSNSEEKDSLEIQNTDKNKIGHDISMDNYIYLQTSGRVYRHIFDIKSMPINTIERDIYLYYFYLDRGKTYFNHNIETVYRISCNGCWNGLSKKEKKNNLFEVVFTATKLLNYKYPKFFVNSLPKCIFKKSQKIIGCRMALYLFIFSFSLKKIYCNIASRFK